MGGSNGNESAYSQETGVPSLGWEDALEKGMATHSSILAWRIPWREKPSGLQSMRSQRVRHDWVTNTLTLESKKIERVKVPASHVLDPQVWYWNKKGQITWWYDVSGRVTFYLLKSKFLFEGKLFYSLLLFPNDCKTKLLISSNTGGDKKLPHDSPLGR